MEDKGYKIEAFLRQREKDLLKDILIQFEKQKWADSTDALRATGVVYKEITGKRFNWTKAIEEGLSND